MKKYILVGENIQAKVTADTKEGAITLFRLKGYTGKFQLHVYHGDSKTEFAIINI